MLPIFDLLFEENRRLRKINYELYLTLQAYVDHYADHRHSLKGTFGYNWYAEAADLLVRYECGNTVRSAASVDRM